MSTSISVRYTCGGGRSANCPQRGASATVSRRPRIASCRPRPRRVAQARGRGLPRWADRRYGCARRTRINDAREFLEGALDRPGLARSPEPEHPLQSRRGVRWMPNRTVRARRLGLSGLGGPGRDQRFGSAGCARSDWPAPPAAPILALLGPSTSTRGVKPREAAARPARAGMAALPRRGRAQASPPVRPAPGYESQFAYGLLSLRPAAAWLSPFSVPISSCARVPPSMPEGVV